jgi:hypothetical protein
MVRKANQTADTRSFSLKVSEKGAVSLYGLRRFPVTFYADEWRAVLGKSDAILRFIEANRSKLSDKQESGGVVGGTRI